MPSTFAQAIQVITKALGPIPKYQFIPGNDDNTKETGLLLDLQHLNIEDYKTLNDVVNATVSGQEDDNELLQERVVTLLAKLPLTPGRVKWLQMLSSTHCGNRLSILQPSSEAKMLVIANQMAATIS